MTLTETAIDGAGIQFALTVHLLSNRLIKKSKDVLLLANSCSFTLTTVDSNDNAAPAINGSS